MPEGKGKSHLINKFVKEATKFPPAESPIKMIFWGSISYIYLNFKMANI